MPAPVALMASGAIGREYPSVMRSFLGFVPGADLPGLYGLLAAVGPADRSS